MDIYNILGQKVRTLVNEEHGAGSYAIRWNGRDQNGKSVPSGVYVYRLRTEKSTLSKKMLYLQ
jgi:flagellar hook assembly protein FlgD